MRWLEDCAAPNRPGKATATGAAKTPQFRRLSTADPLMVIQCCGHATRLGRGLRLTQWPKLRFAVVLCHSSAGEFAPLPTRVAPNVPSRDVRLVRPRGTTTTSEHKVVALATSRRVCHKQTSSLLDDSNGPHFPTEAAVWEEVQTNAPSAVLPRQPVLRFCRVGKCHARAA